MGLLRRNTGNAMRTVRSEVNVEEKMAASIGLTVLGLVATVIMTSLLYSHASPQIHGLDYGARDQAIPYQTLLRHSRYLTHFYSFSFTEEETACVDKEQVLYNGECYALLLQGPCGDSEWLVIDKRRAMHPYKRDFRAVCRTRPCPQSYFLIREYEKCYHSYDIGRIFCPWNMNLTYSYNIFGEYTCNCSGSLGHLIDSNDKHCYTWYSQGPCPPGYVFVPLNDVVGYGHGTCEQDVCAGDRKNAEQALIPIVFDDGEIVCYKIGETGPCDNQMYIVRSNAFPGVIVYQCDYHYNGMFGGIIPITSVGNECVLLNNGTCAQLLRPSLKPNRVPLK